MVTLAGLLLIARVLCKKGLAGVHKLGGEVLTTYDTVSRAEPALKALQAQVSPYWRLRTGCVPTQNVNMGHCK